MRTLSFRITALSLSLVLGLAACKKDEQAAAGPGGGQQMPPPAVSVVTLKAQNVTLTNELPGRTSAYLIAEVRPQVSGIVQKRLFNEGGLVKAGQALYQIDDSSYRATSNSAQASLAQARAGLINAQQTQQRTAALAQIDAVSKQDNENALAALRQAEAQVKAAQANVDSAAVTLGYARVTAPISGRIGKSSVTPGALVTASQANPLATIQQMDPIYVDIAQSSAELLALRKGLADGNLESLNKYPVDIILEDGTTYSHKGELEFSEVTVDPTTGKYSTRVVVKNPDNILMPGMYVRAIVGSAVRENAILAPQRGITRDPKGGSTAMIVGKDGKVEARQVQVSRTIGDQWLVDGGLVAGDKLIVEGLQKIQPGIPVQATEASAAKPAGQAPGANAKAPASPESAPASADAADRKTQ